MATTTQSRSTTALAPAVAKQLCIDSMRIMASGDLPDFYQIVHPQAVNREAKDEPPACAEPGPNGFYASALWLRKAFADLSFEIHDVVTEGDHVVVHNMPPTPLYLLRMTLARRRALRQQRQPSAQR